MKFTAAFLTFLGATSLVAAAPLVISQRIPGPEGLVKRQHPVTVGCRQADTKCSWKSALCWSIAERCYQQCMKEEGCYSPNWDPPPVIETKEKRDSQDHCGLRNFQCESQAEFANPGTNITAVYQTCMEESGCQPALTHDNLTTEHLTKKRWHPHCGAFQSFKCNAKANKPSRWGDPDADVKKEYRACMIENKCRCAIEYPYYCNKDNS